MSSMALCPAEVWPAVATGTWPGRARMASTRSGKVWYGVLAFTPTTAVLATVRYTCQSASEVSSMASTP